MWIGSLNKSVSGEKKKSGGDREGDGGRTEGIEREIQ